jgi:hypothetical protein
MKHNNHISHDFKKTKIISSLKKQINTQKKNNYINVS